MHHVFFSIETVDYWFRVSGGGAYEFNKTEGFFPFNGDVFMGKANDTTREKRVPVFFSIETNLVSSVRRSVISLLKVNGEFWTRKKLFVVWNYPSLETRSFWFFFLLFLELKKVEIQNFDKRKEGRKEKLQFERTISYDFVQKGETSFLRANLWRNKGTWPF